MKKEECLNIVYKMIADGIITQDDAVKYFPELKCSKESKDKEILKAIAEGVQFCEKMLDWSDFGGMPIDDILAWIEKQGKQETLCDKCRKEQPSHSCQDITALGRCAVEHEQKPVDKTEQKFKVGEWVVTSYGKVNQVIAVDKDGDGFTLDDGTYFSGSWKDIYHLWTIQDAKDGDVLATLDYILIFKEFLKDDGGISYCHYDFGSENPQFIWLEDKNWYFGKEAIIHPATKEQYDLLFQKMREAGYEWVFEKKELRIKPKFKVGDIIRHKEQGFTCKISAVDTEYRVSDCSGTHLPFDSQDAYELVERKHSWSENDETIKNNISHIISQFDKISKKENQPCWYVGDCLLWMQNIKDRVQTQNTWKPTDAQMVVLNDVINNLHLSDVYAGTLKDLQKDLKKLREEGVSYER